MVSSEPVLLVVAADRREFAALVKPGSGFEPGPAQFRWSRLGRLGGRPALLTAHGPGRDNAANSVELAARKFSLAAIISTGFAGALDPGFRAGDGFLASEVIQSEGGLKYPVELPQITAQTPPKRGALLTVDSVVQNAAARLLLRESGACTVDMEASAVAEQAARRGLPFYCVRAISDEANSDFGIDFNAARRADGTFSGWRIVGQAGISAARWRELLSLRRDSLKAAETLAHLLTHCRFKT